MIRWRSWMVAAVLGVWITSACGADDAGVNPKTSADASTAGQAGFAGTGGTSIPDGSLDGAAGIANTGGKAGTGGAAGSGLPVDAGPPGGPVDLPGVYNARNTGGLSTSSGKRVRRNFLIRSGHLAELGSDGCQRLSDLKIRSVVDLRAASDAGSNPDASCVAASTAYFLADLPKILPPSPTSYAQTLDAAEPKLAAIWGHLGKADALPAIVHCVIGRDRASLITAMLLLSLGVPQDQVVEDFVANQDSTVTVDAAWLQPMLDRVQAAGGIDAYLLSHGVTQAMLDQLRAMALE